MKTAEQNRAFVLSSLESITTDGSLILNAEVFVFSIIFLVLVFVIYLCVNLVIGIQ